MKIKQIRDKLKKEIEKMEKAESLKESCKNYFYKKFKEEWETEFYKQHLKNLKSDCAYLDLKLKLSLLNEIIPAFIEDVEEWWYEQNDGGVDEFDVGYVKIYRGDIEELIKNLKGVQDE